MKTNKKTQAPSVYTHEGARVRKGSAYAELRRTVMSCLLWEDGFYESGSEIADRITKLVRANTPGDVVGIAIEARSKMNLRHVPLLLLRELVRIAGASTYVERGLVECIQRPDELTEFMALYWKDDKNQSIAACVKRGLAKAFLKFNEFQLAKYNAVKDIRLRDVMFLVHPKPANEDQAKTFKLLADDKLPAPDTWEVQLSGGANKKATFERLISENKLGALALLRNLRLMEENGVDRKTISNAILNMNTERVLPFRFITAAKYAPKYEAELEKAMLSSLSKAERLKGRTAIIIDTSPSMWQAKVSAKSEMDRFDAAAALAILIRGICDDVAVYAFNHKAYVVPPRQGFALRDALAKTKDGYSCGGLAVEMANKDGYDRIIVLTDGEWHVMGAGSTPTTMGKATQVSPKPLTKLAYMLNVSTSVNAVGYGDWLTIDGWSEACVQYIQGWEALGQ